MCDWIQNRAGYWRWNRINYNVTSLSIKHGLDFHFTISLVLIITNFRADVAGMVLKSIFLSCSTAVITYKLSFWVTGLICFWEEGGRLKLREDLRLAIPLQLVLCTQIFFLWLTLIADCIGLIVKQCDSSIYIIERIIHIVQRLPQCKISLCLGDRSRGTISCGNWDNRHWWGRRRNSQSVNPTQLQNASGIGNYLYTLITMLTPHANHNAKVIT